MEEIVNQLEEPASYPYEIEDVEKITTAISQVFLAGEHAYKVCKPVNLDFLDFSTE